MDAGHDVGEFERIVPAQRPGEARRCLLHSVESEAADAHGQDSESWCSRSGAGCLEVDLDDGHSTRTVSNNGLSFLCPVSFCLLGCRLQDSLEIAHQV